MARKLMFGGIAGYALSAAALAIAGAWEGVVALVVLASAISAALGATIYYEQKS